MSNEEVQIKRTFDDSENIMISRICDYASNGIHSARCEQLVVDNWTRAVPGRAAPIPSKFPEIHLIFYSGIVGVFKSSNTEHS